MAVKHACHENSRVFFLFLVGEQSAISILQGSPRLNPRIMDKSDQMSNPTQIVQSRLLFSRLLEPIPCAPLWRSTDCVSHDGLRTPGLPSVQSLVNFLNVIRHPSGVLTNSSSYLPAIMKLSPPSVPRRVCWAWR